MKYTPIYRIQGKDVLNLDGSSTPFFIEDNELKYVDQSRVYAKIEKNGKLVHNGEYTKMRIIDDRICQEADQPNRPSRNPTKKISDETLALEKLVA